MGLAFKSCQRLSASGLTTGWVSNVSMKLVCPSANATCKVLLTHKIRRRSSIYIYKSFSLKLFTLYQNFFFLLLMLSNFHALHYVTEVLKKGGNLCNKKNYVVHIKKTWFLDDGEIKINDGDSSNNNKNNNCDINMSVARWFKRSAPFCLWLLMRIHPSTTTCGTRRRTHAQHICM